MPTSKTKSDSKAPKALSKEQSTKFFSELNSIHSNKKYAFNRVNSPYSVNARQAEGVKQAALLFKSTLPASASKDAMLKFLDAEAKYFQQIAKLNLQRTLLMKDLYSYIIGPGGTPISPYAPIPFGEMVLVGWDEDNNEIWYNTDDGYYYKRDSAGSNTFTRYNGKFNDDKGEGHDAKELSEDCTWGQWFYRFWGKDKLKFPDSFMNKWDLKYRDMKPFKGNLSN
jgi:hypothetical protein